MPLANEIGRRVGALALRFLYPEKISLLARSILWMFWAKKKAFAAYAALRNYKSRKHE